MRRIRLVPIDRHASDSTAWATRLERSSNAAAAGDVVEGVAQAQMALYARTGATAPWIGYLAFDPENEEVLGSCSFVCPPSDGSVEIAYFTFPPFEGQGVASAMAAELLAIARAADPRINVQAHTMPEENASTHILCRLGFEVAGLAQDEEVGEVWLWEKRP